ncbi:MAG TPA: ABC transporter permease, partial [Rhizomicrobium sp.]|nr:ABC transporter permease [Rhizomicrobium sp.]
MIANAFLLALREIRNNVLRAGLTTLGIVIGVAAVIAMVTLGSGATKSVTSDIASMGRNLIIVSPGGNRRGPPTAATPFKDADAQAIAREIPGLLAVAPQAEQSAVAVNANQNHNTRIIGTTNAFFTAREWPVIAGRVFTTAELRGGKSVCIIGQTVRKELFGSQDVVGAKIRI